VVIARERWLPKTWDFVAAHVDAVRETAIREFLVSHFHLPQPGYAKFLIQPA